MNIPVSLSVSLSFSLRPEFTPRLTRRYSVKVDSTNMVLGTPGPLVGLSRLGRRPDTRTVEDDGSTDTRHRETTGEV